jgi:CRISPR-associated protein Csh2
MTIQNNSEILFLFDAKQSNPNGDMDDENKPRMDWETETNLVSDVRLKRYVRDYLENFKGKELFITSKYKKAEDAAKKLKEKKLSQEDCIDVKMFGAVLADKGANTHFTGPIQFNWGYSLNKVELQETKTITSSFSSGEGVGKDFRVKYSFIAFSGSINSKNAGEGKVDLSNEDINLFDEAMVKSIPLSRTRSKIGQTPRLYLRVELKNGDSFLKDLREFIKLDNPEELKKVNSITGVKLNCVDLGKYFEENKEIIEKIYYYKDSNLNIEGLNFDKSYFEELSFK